MTTVITLSNVVYTSQLNIDESLTDSIDPTVPAVPVPSNTGGKFVFGQGGVDAALDTLHGEITLVAGVATINLTAFTSAYIAAARTMAGKKLLLFSIQADPDNTDEVTVEPGASNPYSGAFTGLIVWPGDTQTLGPLNKATQILVDATHKNIDLASPMATAKVIVEMVFG